MEGVSRSVKYQQPRLAEELLSRQAGGVGSGSTKKGTNSGFVDHLTGDIGGDELTEIRESSLGKRPLTRWRHFIQT